jgi:hypothetical protein
MKLPATVRSAGPGDAPVDCEFTDKMVKGKVFVNQKREHVVIGIAGKAAEILGLEYLAWQELEKRYNCTRADHHIALVERDRWRSLYYEDRNMFYHVLYRYIKQVNFGVPTRAGKEWRSGKQGSV